MATNNVDTSASSSQSGEVWKPVNGFEGYYEVSNHGRIRRIAGYQSTYKGRLLSLSPNSTGYPQITLSRPGKRKKMFVHRVVARAFLGPCPEGCEVNHIDGDKANNFASNLEYVTPSENRQHAYDQGLITPASGEKHGTKTHPECYRGERASQAKLTADDVREIRRRAGSETQRAIADDFGVDPSTISNVVRRKTWGHIE